VRKLPAEITHAIGIDGVDLFRTRFTSEQRKHSGSASYVHNAVSGLYRACNRLAVRRKAHRVSHHLAEFIERIHFSFAGQSSRTGILNARPARPFRSIHKVRRFSLHRNAESRVCTTRGSRAG